MSEIRGSATSVVDSDKATPAGQPDAARTARSFEGTATLVVDPLFFLERAMAGEASSGGEMGGGGGMSAGAESSSLPAPPVSSNPADGLPDGSSPATPESQPAGQFGEEYDFRAPEAVPASASPDNAAAAASPASEQGGRPVQTAAGQQPPAQISQQQLQRASVLGLTPAQISQFTDPNALETSLQAAEAVAFRILQAQNAQRPQQQVQQPPPPQPPPDFNFEAEQKKFMEQGFDEPYAKALAEQRREMHQIQVERFQERQQLNEAFKWVGQQAQLTQVHQQNFARQAVEGAYNDFINGLDPETKAALSDPQMRTQLLTTADYLAAGMQARGQQTPQLETLLAQAKNVVLADKVLGVAREQVRREVATHQGRAISRPSGSNAPKPTNPDEAAVGVADQWYAKNLGSMNG